MPMARNIKDFYRYIKYVFAKYILRQNAIFIPRMKLEPISWDAPLRGINLDMPPETYKILAAFAKNKKPLKYY